MKDHFASTISNRMRIVAPVAAIAGLAAHRLPALAQATPEATSPVTADPAAVLSSAITTMDALKSYHFTLETQGGGITIVPQLLALYSLDGDVLRPDAVRATGEAMAVLLPIPITVVSIDGNTWITNPLGAAGLGGNLVNINEIGSLISFDPGVAINPDHVALPLLGLIQNPTIDQAGSTDVSLKIDGVIPRSSLADVQNAFDNSAVFSSLAADGADLTASVWVDHDSQVVAMDLSGELLANEDESLLRHYTFDKFDEPIVIERP